MLFASYRADSESIGLLSRFRPLATLIDWLVVVVGALALLTGLLAVLGSLYTADGEGIHRWGGQLVVLLVVFAGLVALHFIGSRWVRRVSSLITLGVGMVALVGWAWAVIDDLTPTNTDFDSLTLGGGMILTGISLGLQIGVGLLMFTAAFPLAAVLSATADVEPSGCTGHLDRAE
jgi:hypothetical protein